MHRGEDVCVYVNRTLPSRRMSYTLLKVLALPNVLIVNRCTFTCVKIDFEFTN